MMCLPVLAALAKAGAPRAAGASIGGVENTHGMSGGPAILGTGSPVHAVSDGGLISQDEARHLTDLLRARRPVPSQVLELSPGLRLCRVSVVYLLSVLTLCLDLPSRTSSSPELAYFV